MHVASIALNKNPASGYEDSVCTKVAFESITTHFAMYVAIYRTNKTLGTMAWLEILHMLNLTLQDFTKRWDKYHSLRIQQTHVHKFHVISFHFEIGRVGSNFICRMN